MQKNQDDLSVILNKEIINILNIEGYQKTDILHFYHLNYNKFTLNKKNYPVTGYQMEIQAVYIPIEKTSNFSLKETPIAIILLSEITNFFIYSNCLLS